MAGVITGRRCLLLVAGLIWCALLSASAFAAAGGGYEGLIAPAVSEDSASSSKTDDQVTPTAGYAGLIPDASNEGKSLYITSMPGVAVPGALKTVEDVQLLAATYEQGGILNDLQKSLSLSDQVKRRLEKPRQRIENVLPMEYAARRNIEGFMSKIHNNNSSPEDLAKNVSAARQRLSSMAEGLRYKLMMPDSLYQRMGVSDVFVSEEKEGAGKALALLNSALRELDKY